MGTADLWNIKQLPPPPNLTCKSQTITTNIKLLERILKDAVEFFSNQPELAIESAALSRLIYKTKMKFRSSKDFKPLDRINRCLLNYLQMNMPQIFENLYLLMPQIYEYHSTYVPSKNSLDYVLVRLQSLGKLLCRLFETCQIAAKYQHQRLKLGHFWNISLICYGMIARIFVIIKYMIKYTCNLYADLKPFTRKLQNSGPEWLPSDYNLPDSLKEWLDIDWPSLDTTIIEIPDEEPSVMSYFNLVDDSDDDDIEISDEYVLIDDEDSVLYVSGGSDDEKPSTSKKKKRKFNRSQDFSEISRPWNEELTKPKLKGLNDDEDVDVGEVIEVLDTPLKKRKMKKIVPIKNKKIKVKRRRRYFTMKLKN